MTPWTKISTLFIFVGTAVASTASAKFAASNGEFSGREGDTCTLCHARASATPAARVDLEGLPPRWDAGASYALTIRVEGGPTPLPTPRPQGGFELETSGGTFAPGPGMAGYLRFPQPHVITYTAEGTRMREWRVDWIAPGPGTNPMPITFWLAGVAANGNHVASGDDGASGDATDALTRRVRASDDTVAAWQAIPLRSPIVDEIVRESDRWAIRGHHADDNATHLGYRLGDAAWQSVPTAREWSLLTRHDPASLDLRSEGWGRVSMKSQEAPTRATPLPAAVALLAACAALLLRRLAPQEVHE